MAVNLYYPHLNKRLSIDWDRDDHVFNSFRHLFVVLKALQINSCPVQYYDLDQLIERLSGRPETGPS